MLQLSAPCFVQFPFWFRHTNKEDKRKKDKEKRQEMFTHVLHADRQTAFSEEQLVSHILLIYV